MSDQILDLPPLERDRADAPLVSDSVEATPQAPRKRRPRRFELPVPADVPAISREEAIEDENGAGESGAQSWLRFDGPHLRPAGNRAWHYLVTKRACDVTGSLVLLVVLSPVIVITLLILTVTTRFRPIFRQQRVGHCGRPFYMYKFRTMVPDAQARRHLVENQHQGPIFKNCNDPRVTRVGRVLRSTSIDELPQLFNVLLGQMSLVGPRPPLAHEVAEYEPWQRKRLTVKPGLTCLWQVAGRSEIGFEDWMRMDVWYTENQSLRTDTVLLLRTPWSVLSRRGAY